MLNLNRASPRDSVQHLLEAMYDAIDRPSVNRDYLRDLTDQISTITMAYAAPCQSNSIVDLMSEGLTRQEATLAEYMIQNVGKTFSREHLVDIANANKATKTDYQKLVDVVVCRVRRKFTILRKPYNIENCRGVGYRIVKIEDGMKRRWQVGGWSERDGGLTRKDAHS